MGRDAAWPGIDNRFTGEDFGLTWATRGLAYQPLQDFAGGFITLLDDAQVADGEQNHFVPVIIVDPLSKEIDNGLQAALSLLGDAHGGKVLLKGEMDKTKSALPPLDEQTGVVTSVLENLVSCIHRASGA
ncbi:MAG: hypothetical protein ACE5EY_12620, partial [Anaerolineae bacterium]